MLSLTCEYALRAMIYLAIHESEWPIPGKLIAQQAGIPPKYLSKVLGDLARGGLLTATRGKSGGFQLAQSAEEISLQEVLMPFERNDPRRCPFGNDRCSDDDPCMAHEGWKQVQETYRQFLQRTSLYDVAAKEDRGQTKTNKRIQPCTLPEPG